jgi:hypothetical protein
VRIAVLSRDLILASRILGQTSAGGHEGALMADPSALPPSDTVDLLFVNWADRDHGWADALTAWQEGAAPQRRPRLVLYGPHTDLAAHAAARAANLGPMLARSKLVAALPRLLGGAPATPGTIVAKSQGHERTIDPC